MEFRWVAIIALWTILSAPVFDVPPAQTQIRSAPQVEAEIEDSLLHD